MENYLFISIGAVLGANLRFWLGGLAAKWWGIGFPFGTLMINGSGSFILAFFLTLTTDRILIDPRVRVLFSVGFLGAFTTFSTFTFESVQLIQKGHWQAGLINLFGSAIIGSLAAFAGIYLAKTI